MRISVAADSRDGVAPLLPVLLARLGHEVTVHGALAEPGDGSGGEGSGDRSALWSVCARAAAREVAEGRADQAVVACWTGTGVSIAANKVPGIRAALCTDAATAAGARRWNDANVLALSLRLLSEPVLDEIFEAWFTALPGTDPEDTAALAELEPAAEPGPSARPEDTRTP